MSPTSIYERHLRELVEAAGRRQPDPSRLDTEVAVRLAVTGHTREQIITTIGQGARAARPAEKRDWDAYARRAAEFVSSPPGQWMKDHMRPEAQRLLRLEDRRSEMDLLRRRGGPLGDA